MNVARSAKNVRTLRNQTCLRNLRHASPNSPRAPCGTTKTDWFDWTRRAAQLMWYRYSACRISTSWDATRRLCAPAAAFQLNPKRFSAGNLEAATDATANPRADES